MVRGWGVCQLTHLLSLFKMMLSFLRTVEKKHCHVEEEDAEEERDEEKGREGKGREGKGRERKGKETRKKRRR